MDLAVNLVFHLAKLERKYLLFRSEFKTSYFRLQRQFWIWLNYSHGHRQFEGHSLLQRKKPTTNLTSTASTTSARRISLIEQLIFFDQQNPNGGIDAIVLSLIRSVAKRLALNSIEFIQSKVSRSFDFLAVKNFIWRTWQQQHRRSHVSKIKRLLFCNR